MKISVVWVLFLYVFDIVFCDDSSQNIILRDKTNSEVFDVRFTKRYSYNITKRKPEFGNPYHHQRNRTNTVSKPKNYSINFKNNVESANFDTAGFTDWKNNVFVSMENNTIVDRNESINRISENLKNNCNTIKTVEASRKHGADGSFMNKGKIENKANGNNLKKNEEFESINIEENLYNEDDMDYFNKRFKRRILFNRNNTNNAFTIFKQLFSTRLTIRSVNVNLDWSEMTPDYKSADLVGFSLVLYDFTEPVVQIMNNGRRGHFYTINRLEQDKIYKGSIKLLSNENEAKKFYTQVPTSNNTEEFELSTPFIVADEDLKNIQETRALLEDRLKGVKDFVKIRHVDINLLFSRIDKPGFIIELSRYDKSPNITALPADQIIRLLPPIRDLVLSDLKPHELIKISLKSVQQNENQFHYSTIKSINVFTGGAYRLGLTNLSRLLETHHNVNYSRIVNNIHHGNNHVHSGNKRSVSCYSDDDTYSGYPCRNSDMCIPHDWVCDGEPDCLGRDDEHGCNEDASNYDHEYHYRGSCRKYEFRCRSRSHSVCLPNSWLCDGRIDCQDGWDEDEDNCFRSYNSVRPGFTSTRGYYESNCPHNHFRCWTGKDCVSSKDVCDGHDDCLDGSDERICENWSIHCDLGFEFRCYKSSSSSDSYYNRKCIPRSWVCDEQEDCEDGEDESHKMCRIFHKFSLSNILAPFGIDFAINAGFNNL